MILKGDGFEIRPLTACKLDAAVQVYRQAGGDDRRDPQRKITGLDVLEDIDLSRQEGGLVCGIYDTNDEMVGVVEFVPADFGGRSDSACIRSFKVAGPYRSRGLGVKVLKLLEGEFKKDARVRLLWAGFDENCPTQQAFAARHGFRAATQEDLLKLSNPGRVTMVKELE